MIAASRDGKKYLIYEGSLHDDCLHSQVLRWFWSLAPAPLRSKGPPRVVGCSVQLQCGLRLALLLLPLLQ